MDPSSIIISIPVFVFAIVIHEAAHGWMAEKCGDPTARNMGRITLNPIPHIDLMYSIILPLTLIFFKSPILFGGAKPVPINYFNLRKPKRDFALVGLAGPFINILTALVSILLLKGIVFIEFIQFHGLITLLVLSFKINIVLAAFNLIPIPPLDGSRFVSAMLPDDLSYKYNMIEPYGVFIVFLLIATGIFDMVFYPIVHFLEFVVKSIVF